MPVPLSRFTDARRFPLQRKCGRTHCAFPGCTVVRCGRLFDKISAAAFFSRADSRVKTANLPRQKICRGKADLRHRLRRAKCASAVRPKQFTSVRGAQGIPHTACGPAFRECFRLFLSRRPSRHRYAQPMSAIRRAGR